VFVFFGHDDAAIARPDPSGDRIAPPVSEAMIAVVVATRARGERATVRGVRLLFLLIFNMVVSSCEIVGHFRDELT
jgi:hypothetical protein